MFIYIQNKQHEKHYLYSQIFKKKNHNRWTQKTTRKDKILRVVTYPKELKSGKRQMNENGKQSHISSLLTKLGMKPKPTFLHCSQNGYETQAHILFVTNLKFCVI